MATTTSQNYTDQDIVDALRIAAQDDSVRIDIEEGERCIAGFEITDLRRFLDALPDQQDDWQACAWDDILHTDSRVKAEYIGSTVFEGVPDGISDKGIHLVDGNFMPYVIGAKWYRIPAPVQHPNPEAHPVIYVKDCDIVGFIPKIMVWYRDSYVAGRQGLSPEQITDWQQIDPAKVVADNDC